MLDEFGKSPMQSPPPWNNFDNGEYLKYKFDAPSQWLEAKHNTYVTTGKTIKSLAEGSYVIKWDNNDEKPIFQKTEIIIDDLIFTDNVISQNIINEVKTFWDKVDTYKKVGYLHRRGFLLYGSHGTGKTSIVRQIIKDLIEEGGLIFICGDPDNFKNGLKSFREVEPTRKVVCLYEDIDALIKKHGEQSILSLLDGEDQINYVFNLATTNYPESLDKRIVARPRRFDRVIKIESPSYESRLAYFKVKLDPKDNASKWAKDSAELSFASLAELVIAVKCFNEDFKKTIERLKKLKTTPSSSDSEGGDVGFTI